MVRSNVYKLDGKHMGSGDYDIVQHGVVTRDVIDHDAKPSVVNGLVSNRAVQRNAAECSGKWLRGGS